MSTPAGSSAIAPDCVVVGASLALTVVAGRVDVDCASMSAGATTGSVGDDPHAHNHSTPTADAKPARLRIPQALRDCETWSSRGLHRADAVDRGDLVVGAHGQPQAGLVECFLHRHPE